MNNEIIISFESDDSFSVSQEEQDICKNYSSAKRISEFKKGRNAAKNCLKKLGIENFPILKSESGAPIWPETVIGSISHSHNLAVAAVSKKNKYLGIDIEYLKQERNLEIFKRICTEREINWMQNNLEKGLRIFSAKEAIYKAFFSLIKLTWLDVELTETAEGFLCTFTKKINNLPLTFQCQQSKHDDYLLSIVAL